MTTGKAKGDAAEIIDVVTGDDGGSASTSRPTVAQGMRPIFSEVARLSATLGIARTACYTGDPAKAVRALALLAKQLPLAQETAELLAPSE